MKIYSIKQEYVGTRLDRWFKRNICDVPQGLIEKNLRKGKIKINNKKTRSSYKLLLNDRVHVINFKPQVNLNKKVKLKYLATKKDVSASSKFIIEDNENFVVLNKPPGISVQAGTKSRRNILDIISKTKYFENLSPYPVHRIDKETSGILIVAKNRKFAQLFTSMFRLRKIHKVYICIAIGTLEKKEGTLVDDLIYDEGKKIKLRAITHYKVLDSNNNYSLLKLTPETGRKHQLRRQLLMRNCPVLGDSKYKLRETHKSKKSFLMLHAYKINFSINDQKYKFSAELPDYFKKALNEKYLKIY